MAVGPSRFCRVMTTPTPTPRTTAASTTASTRTSATGRPGQLLGRLLVASVGCPARSHLARQRRRVSGAEGPVAPAGVAAGAPAASGSTGGGLAAAEPGSRATPPGAPAEGRTARPRIAVVAPAAGAGIPTTAAGASSGSGAVRGWRCGDDVRLGPTGAYGTEGDVVFGVGVQRGGDGELAVQQSR